MKAEFLASKNDYLIKQIEQNTELNFNQIKSVLRKKDVKLDGKKISQNLFVNVGQKIEVFFKDKQFDLRTIYQDDNVLIVDKPAGVEVANADASLNAQTLENMTGCMAVHRIDRNTTGLVVLAKNEQSKQELEKAFKLHAIEKYYTCVVVGQPKVAEKNMTAYLFKDSKNSFVKIFDSEQKGTCEIKTNYKLLKTNGKLSLLQVELLTGKTHQIRAHLAHENLPILGDEKYGNKLANKLYGKHRQLLASTKMVFHFNSQSVLKNLDGKKFEISTDFENILNEK